MKLAWVAVFALLAVQPVPGAEPFVIEVVDDQTGRGVPMVELKTVSNVRFVTDSAGIAAIDDPTLLDGTVFFYVSSHGYEIKPDGFGSKGRRLEPQPGQSAKIEIHRANVAERLYRITGEGIYRDSVLAGRAAPIKNPLLNGQVVGQDSVQAAVYKGKIRWFWGDTLKPSYPIGQFWTSGATSDLPGQGGLDPSVGVNLNYFVGEDGFSRPMLPKVAGELAWLDGLTVLKDSDGRERLVARSARMKSLSEPLGSQLVVYNDKLDRFDVIKDIPRDAQLYPCVHPFPVEQDGIRYMYCGEAFPSVRFKADFDSFQDLSSYEAFTCLAPGTRFEIAETKFDRDKAGRLVWGWKKNTSPIDPAKLGEFVKSGEVKPDEVWMSPRDVETKEPVRISMASVQFNAFRKKWIGVGGQLGGKSSLLGEIWYSEADRPEGPWKWARKIVTHDRYSFYNPVMHPFFEQEEGRKIYFEGTYTVTFARSGDETPRYEYNQIMYRLDLADPRLAIP